MFNEVKEMLDATIYGNGNGEITAQNVNLAMHSIVDAAENAMVGVNENINSVNAKIEDVEKQLEEGGLGGLEFQFPMMILLMLLEVSSVDEMYFDRERAAEITAELPFLSEPIEKMFEANANAYEKYKSALKNGESTPMININLGALYKEIIEFEMAASGLNYDYVIGMHGVANIIQFTSIAGIEEMFVCLMSIMGSNVALAFLPDGTCGVMEREILTTIYIPRLGDEAYENSSDAIMALDFAGTYSGSLIKNDFVYGTSIGEAITPVHAKKSEIGTNLFIRFIVDNNIIEGVINLESGLTTSRLVATMEPQELDMIVEGSLKCDYTSVSSYGTTVSFTIKSNVDWKLVEGETVMTTGTATTNGSYSYSIPANTTTEIVNHNYRLVDASNENELSTVWVEQEASTETTVSE